MKERTRPIIDGTNTQNSVLVKEKFKVHKTEWKMLKGTLYSFCFPLFGFIVLSFQLKRM
jgi:hypothetical protein